MQDENRILQVCALNAGGIETFVMNVYRELRKENIIFDFVNYFDKEEKQFHEEEVLKYGSKVYKTGSMNIRNPFKKQLDRIRELNLLLKNNRYDVVHIHVSDNISLLDAVVAKKNNVKKIIVHSHNSSLNREEKNYIIKQFIQITTKFLWKYLATDFLACSKVAAKWMFGDIKEVEIVKNAIDINKYSFDEYIRKKYRDDMGLENTYVLGHIGRFSYQKNHRFLIEIFKEVLKIEDNYKLLLIGEGELKEEIINLSKKYGINDKIVFYGKSRECESLMQAMDMFILPSHFEGLPLVGIEAQCSGLKIISSDTVSDEMKVTNNIEFISLKLSAKEWAEIINSNINYERKNESKNVTKAGFNIEEVSKKIKDIYLRIV